MFFDGSEKRFRSLATTEGEEARPSFPPGNPAGPFHPPQSRLSPDPPPLSHTLSVPPFETDDHTGPKKKPKKQTKLPDEEKASVRSGLLPALLRERDPRLSTALAMALALALALALAFVLALALAFAIAFECLLAFLLNPGSRRGFAVF